MKKILLVLFLMTTQFIFKIDLVIGQSMDEKWRNISVGDTIPQGLWDMALEVVNHEEGKNSITLNEYRQNKIIILDFWATWCGSCIKKMPEMVNINDDFKESVQVILITKEDKTKAKNFFSRNVFRIPSIVNDSIFSKLFEHLSIPHYVIMNSEGVVIAVTSSDEITGENIAKILDGLSPKMKVKIDKDTKKPLFLVSDLPIQQLKHSSLFLKGRLEGYPSSKTNRKIGNVVGISFTNVPLLNLFKLVYNKLYPEYGSKRFVLDVSDSSTLSYINTAVPKTEWYKDNLYSYEVLLPSRDSSSIYKIILDDINHFSNFQGGLVFKKIRCLKLITCEKQKTLSIDELSSEANLDFSLKSGLIGDLIEYLNGSLQTPLFITDGTGLKGSLSILLPKNIGSLDRVKCELRKQGLDLVEAEEEMNIFVVSEK